MNKNNLIIRIICTLLIVTAIIGFVPTTMAAGVDKYDLNLYEYR